MRSPAAFKSLKIQAPKRYWTLGLSLALLGATSCANAQQTPPPDAAMKPIALKDAFKNDFLIGTAVSYQSLQGNDDASLALARAQFNAFTPENSMKPDTLERNEGEFRWKDADHLVELADQDGATVVGHTLVWHQQTPRWFFQGENGAPVTREVALERLRKYITTVVGHFKGCVKQWDVVNEAISDSPNEVLRPTPWRTAIGDDYIAEAFRAAHAADPDAILIYNDYNNDRNYKRPKTVAFLKSLLDQGVPINAVGMQCHWQLDKPALDETEEAIKQYAALGLKVMVTEFDISVLKSRNQGADITARENGGNDSNPYVNGLPPEVAAQQADLYKQAFEMFLRHKDVVRRVTIWGPQDGTSWLNNYPIRGRTDYALLFDREGKPKPAVFALLQAAATPVAAPANP